MVDEGIPDHVVEQLRFEEGEELTEIKATGKIIIDRYQLSVKVPREIKTELDFEPGIKSIPCEITLNKQNNTIIVRIIENA